MRRRAGTLALVALATAACGGADEPGRDRGRDATLSRYGLAIDVPPGWYGEISRGALRITNGPLPRLPLGPRALERGALVVELLEREPSPDEWGGIRAAGGTPALAAGDFTAPESGTAPEHHGVARRFLTIAGRVFVLFAQAGSRPVAHATLRQANAALSTLQVEPGDFYPGAVAPATFVPAAGWHTGDGGSFERRPWGEQTQTWAATVPYADGPFDLPPRATIERLPRDGVLIWVGLSRAWDPAAPGERYPVRDPYRVADFEAHPNWEGQVRDLPEYELRTRVEDQYEVDVRLYFGRADPTPAQRAAAESQLARLRLPDWGPWELG